MNRTKKLMTLLLLAMIACMSASAQQSIGFRF